MPMKVGQFYRSEMSMVEPVSVVIKKDRLG